MRFKKVVFFNYFGNAIELRGKIILTKVKNGDLILYF